MLSVLFITRPDAFMSSDDTEIWSSRCIVNSVDRRSLTSFLRFDLAAKHASVDVISFWINNSFAVNYGLQCAAVIEDIRKLPESCCMGDGRKWKKIPCVVLSESNYLDGWQHLRAADVPVVRYSLHDNYHRFDATLRQLRRVVEEYQERVLADYSKVGILVDCENGRCRVKWAL